MPRDKEPKKTISITVRMTETDYERLRQAAAILWPRAEMTDTQRLWGVAKIGIDDLIPHKGSR